MKRLKKEKSFYVKTDGVFLNQVQDVSAAVGVTVSEFVRTAIREKVARVVRGQKATMPLLDYEQAEQRAG